MGKATGAGSRWTRTGGIQKEVREIEPCRPWKGDQVVFCGHSEVIGGFQAEELVIHLLHHSGLLCREWILGRQEWKQGGQREVLQGGLGLG